MCLHYYKDSILLRLLSDHRMTRLNRLNLNTIFPHAFFNTSTSKDENNTSSLAWSLLYFHTFWAQSIIISVSSQLVRVSHLSQSKSVNTTKNKFYPWRSRTRGCCSRGRRSCADRFVAMSWHPQPNDKVEVGGWGGGEGKRRRGTR